jgi:hypothetical protein
LTTKKSFAGGEQMVETLGIMVHSLESRDNLVSLTRAARAKGKKVHILLSSQAVGLLTDATFLTLADEASISVCRQSLDGCRRQAPITCPPGIQLLTLEKWAEALARCDRQVVL